jgi:hypothetical protein
MNHEDNVELWCAITLQDFFSPAEAWITIGLGSSLTLHFLRRNIVPLRARGKRPRGNEST